MRKTVGEVSRLFGVSVRTLHYFDEIGLLKPSDVSEAGYRYYDESALDTLQQILFYRELSFPLKEIARLLHHPDYDKKLAMQRHRELLLLRRSHLDGLLKLVDETIGGMNMSQPKTTLADIEQAKKQYAQEARSRWGDTQAYQQSQKRQKDRTPEQELEAACKADAIFEEFANLRGSSPKSSEAQTLVGRWQAHITEYYYPCGNEILAGLGEMYVGDERFTQNLDRFGEGTAQFMADAIRAYCKKD